MTFNVTFFRECARAVLAGIPVTLAVIIISLLFAFPLGFLFAVIRNKNAGAGAAAIRVFVSFMRGVPMIVQIYVVYSAMPLMLNSFFQSIGSDINVFRINPLLYALLIFILNTTATFSEIFRSALSTVGTGQMEAALLSGLTETQAYARIICPQMIRAASANLCNATVEMAKNTSLVFYMAVKDIMGIIKTKAGVGYNFFEGYVLAFLLYLLICFSIQLIFRLIERRADRNMGQMRPQNVQRHAARQEAGTRGGVLRIMGKGVTAERRNRIPEAGYAAN